MNDVLQRQIAQLKRRVGELEGQLDASKKANMQSPRRSADSETIKGAERLFDALLSARPENLITYSRAYREVIGEYGVWRNAVHAPEIIRLARCTGPRNVAGLSIRLDALIVSKATGRPAQGHFSSSAYSEEVWAEKFGGHPLLS
jgi:hypothetical protein